MTGWPCVRILLPGVTAGLVYNFHVSVAAGQTVHADLSLRQTVKLLRY